MPIGAYHARSVFKNEWDKMCYRKPVAKVQFSDHKLRSEALENCFLHCLGAPGSLAFLISHFAKNFFATLEHLFQDPFQSQDDSLVTSIKRRWDHYFSPPQDDTFSEVLKRQWTYLRESGPALLEDLLAVMAFPAFRTALIVKELFAAVFHPAFAYKQKGAP